MTHHLIDNSSNELELLLEKLKNKKIPYSISQRNGKIISLETDDIELINYAKKNNPNLVSDV
jgi:thymidylate synthase